MGTEIFPQLLFAVRIVVIAVCIISALVVGIAAFDMQFRYKDDKEHKEELKTHIVNGLIAITVVLIAYFILLAIGPAFRLILT